VSGVTPAPSDEHFSVCDCDLYLDHLSRLSMAQQLVVATDDMVNQFGVVLLRGGTPLGPYALDRLRGQRLNRPLDSVVAMRRRPDSAELAGWLLDFIESEPDIAASSEHLGFAERALALCHALDWPEALYQRLAVMAFALPQVFHRALFGAWFGTLVAEARQLPAEDVALVFQAGLLHDVGMLHIEPGLATKRADFSPAEWAQMQAHVELGAQVLEQTWQDVPPRLTRVVREHHERQDGAGYPEHRLQADLDELGSLIALADMIHSLRFAEERAGRPRLHECMSFLRVQRRAFGVANYQPAARVLMAARGPALEAMDAGEAPVSAQGLIDINRSMATLLAAFAATGPLLPSLAESPARRSLLRLVEDLREVASAAGLGNMALERWLSAHLAVTRDEFALRDVLQTMQEAFWLVRRIQRQLGELQAEHRGSNEAIAIKDLSMQVGTELTRAWRRFESRAVAT
jgi:hypothetical protein